MKRVVLKTRNSYDENGIRDITPVEVEVIIDEPNNHPVKLKEEDVWGDGFYNRETKENRGMRVAVYDEECPIFKDIVPYKSVTVVCPKSQEDDVIYWLEYVYGSDCVSIRKELDDLKVALRADYQY